MSFGPQGRFRTRVWDVIAALAFFTAALTAYQPLYGYGAQPMQHASASPPALYTPRLTLLL